MLATRGFNQRCKFVESFNVRPSTEREHNHLVNIPKITEVALGFTRYVVRPESPVEKFFLIKKSARLKKYKSWVINLSDNLNKKYKKIIWQKKKKKFIWIIKWSQNFKINKLVFCRVMKRNNCITRKYIKLKKI